MALIRHKKAGLEYEFLERFEAGLALYGYEVKSLRAGRGKLEGARVVVRDGEGFLVGAQIPAWQEKNAPTTYDQERPRKLLLSQKELHRILGAEKANGITTIPLSIYAKGRYIKLECALARGKKKHDKRETLRKREDARRIERAMKTRRA